MRVYKNINQNMYKIIRKSDLESLKLRYEEKCKEASFLKKRIKKTSRLAN